MDALREIVKSNSQDYRLHLPEWAVGRDVELIILPLAAAGQEMTREQAGSDIKKGEGPLSVLGFANSFRDTKSTEQWMQEFREGERS